ncbi:TadE/TadG family type IV pilus assembly protein [Actinomadura violacea]|uniref:Pilus assembly protein n=1 Tax=Actinomadura violacea TaxID=2819934 RepID=A0ABS3SCL5_9ACTN|nr:pilus assembly protein [Actinomadura violacea]MBO2465985.1 pilus assembly protein [Actinomadura violacea]
MNQRKINRRQRDRGSATVATAITFPAVGLLFLALTQAVMVSVARDVAQSAAEEGLRVARARQGTFAGGRAAAASFARDEPVLQAPAVTVSGANTIAVRVTGSAPSLLPGVNITVSRTARGARERFTTPSAGPT